MGLHRYFPSEPMRAYIEHYTLYTSQQEHTINVLFPENYTEIGINLHNDQISTLIDGHDFPAANIKFLGQMTRPCTTYQLKELLVVRFHPYTASLFFPHSIAEFTNTFYDLSEVYQHDADRLYNQVREAGNMLEKIVAVELFLQGKLAENAKKIHQVRLLRILCAHFSTDHINISVKELSASANISVRYLQRLFEYHIGLSPKTFLNIQRFQKSLHLVSSTKEPYTAIAYQCGYYDQAHFVKSFRQFSDTTPEKYRLKNS